MEGLIRSCYILLENSFKNKQLENTKGPLGCRSEKVEDGKMQDRKDLVFSHMCLVGEVEKWKGEKLFCLVGETNGRMENVIYIN